MQFFIQGKWASRMLLTATSLLFYFSFLDSIYRRSGQQGRMELRFGAKEDSKPQGRRKEFTRYLEPLIRPGFGGYTGQGSESKASFAMQRSGYIQNGVCWTLGPGEYFPAFFFSSLLFFFFFFIFLFQEEGRTTSGHN